jgi:hypothetical protein
MHLVEFSHRSGDSVLGANVLGRLRKSLQSVPFKARRGCSTKLRLAILSQLQASGWSDKVQISPRRKLTITAMQSKVGLCLQTGNMARFYADLLKLQSLFLEETIYGAIYLLPTHIAARQMGQNVANFERLARELSQEFHRVITVPIQIIGFEDGGHNS